MFLFVLKENPTTQMMQFQKEVVMECPLFELNQLQQLKGDEVSPMKKYFYAFKPVSKIEEQDLQLMYQSLHMICGDEKRENVVIIDTMPLMNVKLIKQVFKIQMADMLKINKTGLIKLLVVSKYSIVNISTNFIAKTKGSTHIVKCVKTIEEAFKFACEHDN